MDNDAAKLVSCLNIRKAEVEPVDAKINKSNLATHWWNVSNQSEEVEKTSVSRLFSSR